MTAVYDKADPETRCTCCNRELYGHACRFLELDQRDQTYHDRMDVPTDRSQGWFPFGLACARRIIKQGGKITEQQRQKRVAA